VVARLAAQGLAPARVVEPSCGQGAFLAAAAAAWPAARLEGHDINPAYVADAQRQTPAASVQVTDFFTADWDGLLGGAGELLVLGNPPWVTSADLSALGSANRPARANTEAMPGMEAITGRGNFDVSEWMLLKLLRSLAGRPFTLAMLCKRSVARRVLAHAAQGALPVRGQLHRIDAPSHFGASVAAVLLTLSHSPTPAPPPRWPVYASLSDEAPAAVLGLVGGQLTADTDAFARTAHLSGACTPEWRSGIKHDCARVMELRGAAPSLVSRVDGPVSLENAYVYPFMKGSDVFRGRWPPQRSVVVPQQRIGQETRSIAQRAPKTWAYLQRHRLALGSRKSRIYRGRPEFSVFGVGDYSFTPWKVLVAGLYKGLQFRLVGPHDGKPVVVDDTCYLLPFDDEETARAAHAALSSAAASAFFEARVFWDDKRPVNKQLLQALDLQRLVQGTTAAGPVSQSSTPTPQASP